MKACFGIVSMQKAFKGVLLYKLQRKYATRSGDHPNSNTAFVENTATNIYLVVIWGVINGHDEFRIWLRECTDNFTWDEDKLWVFYEKFCFRPSYILYHKQIPWLMRGDTVIKIRHDMTYGSDYKLDIVISEETGKCVMRKSMKIDPERLVLLLSTLIVLIYTIRPSIKSSLKSVIHKFFSFKKEDYLKLIIHNQCLNVNLVSSVYIINHRSKCRRSPSAKVYAGDIMRSSFIIRRNESYGVLIYRLQGKRPYKSTKVDEDTTIAVHFLVIWYISRYKILYADVLLVEHDKAFTWNKDKLVRLYNENRSLLKKYNGTMSDTWFMDNMVLKTTFSASDLKGNRELNISISEEKKSDDTMRPFYIHPKR
jgi:hypothetical protein